MSFIIAPLNMSFIIASLNVASAFRDEKDCPLYKRLPILESFLKIHQKETGFSILCIQEIRPTGPLSASNVVQKIQGALNRTGGSWEFADQKVNPSASAFHRTIFWDAKKWHHHHQDVKYTTNTREPHFPYLMTKSYFTETESKTNSVIFSVINGHAPMNAKERIDYWGQVKNWMDINTIVVGDLNKFETEEHIYRNMFSDSLEDLVDPETITFVSFPTDRRPDGNLWRSSLDSMIINKKFIDGTVKVVSTEPSPRPTDHFLIVGNFIMLPHNGECFS